MNYKNGKHIVISPGNWAKLMKIRVDLTLKRGKASFNDVLTWLLNGKEEKK